MAFEDPGLHKAHADHCSVEPQPAVDLMPIMWGFRETHELRGSVVSVRSVTFSSVRLCEC